MTRSFLCAGALLSVLFSSSALAHGVVGERFFPATIATDDPFAADELALPTVSYFKGADGTETEVEMEYAKTILPGFAISIEGGYAHDDEAGGPTARGFDNWEVTPIVEVARDEEHEFIASLAMSYEIGGSGSDGFAEDGSAFTPKVQFGKGFGDLPDSAALLKPLAITGTVGYSMPTHGDEPQAVEWGGAIEYSLAYLHSNVRDAGLGEFWSRVTPLVEFTMESPNHGPTTGTINPGLIWSGQSTQFGIEAMIPVNDATGDNVGVIAQAHFYLDDIFPHSLGKPLFE